MDKAWELLFTTEANNSMTQRHTMDFYVRNN